MTPILRLLCAGTLLAAYHYALFWNGPRPAAAAVLSDAAMLRDIDESGGAFSAGRYADALEPTRRLTERMPSQAIYFDRLARIHRELGNRAEEARSWERVFAVSPTPADACPMLGEAYLALHDEARALAAFERCLDVEPENADALLFLGRAYQAAGRGADARRVLEQAVVLAPQYPDLHLLLGVRHFTDGDVSAARQQFERFVELAPERREEVTTWLERTRPVTR